MPFPLCLTLQLSGLTCRLLPCDSWVGGHLMGQAPLYLPPHGCLVQSKDFYPVTAGLGENYSYQGFLLPLVACGSFQAPNMSRVVLFDPPAVCSNL